MRFRWLALAGVLFMVSCQPAVQDVSQNVQVEAPKTSIGGGNVGGDQTNIGGEGNTVNIGDCLEGESCSNQK